LGQNFIFDLNLTSKIARSAGNLTDFEILEIGPGPGGLTRGLLSEGAQKIVAIEKDPRCILALKELQQFYPDRLEIIEGDATKIQQEKYFTKPVKVIANLPYNIGTKLLIDWLTIKNWPPFWHSLTLMFQNEVAQRIVASQGNKSYGRLSVLSNWRCNTSIKMKLNPEVFFPPPKVTSAVVQLEALAEPKYKSRLDDLEIVVASAFNQRRKMLRSSLKQIIPDIETILKDIGIDPSLRAEDLTLEKFCLIANKLNLT
ncbi:MAG: 16S rRNA (adenine(1518)-N(6)/adenine(1519)-N(6))-dimethyltransferase RsmA, partial [Paracoccaceae bacterium]|jgi:16S rRNA (adenine1518-N6/adenine1519-N6)-dimethyltransferase